MRRVNENSIGDTLKKRKFGWIGNTLTRPVNNNRQVGVESSRKSEARPKITWRRSIEKEIGEEGKSWGEVKQLTENRISWRAFVASLRRPRK